MTPHKSTQEPRNVEKFSVVFEGADHEDHEIHILTFGRALTALGEVLYEANEELNGSRDSIDVRVNAEFIEGSFGVEIDVVQLVESTRSVVEALGFVHKAAGSMAIGGVVGLISYLNGKEPKSEVDTKGGAEIETEDGRKAVVAKTTLALSKNEKVRRGLEKLIRAPLQSKGTDEIRFGTPGKKDTDNAALVKISKDQGPFFTKPKAPQVADDDIVEKMTTVVFTGSNVNKKAQWEVELDGKATQVKMKDDLFIERLKNSEEKDLYGRKFSVTLREISHGQAKKYEVVRVHHEN